MAEGFSLFATSWRSNVSPANTGCFGSWPPITKLVVGFHVDAGVFASVTSPKRLSITTPSTTSEKSVAVRASEDENLPSSTFAAPAVSARAVLRTTTVYQSRPALRVAYQLFDAEDNTRVAAPASVVLTIAFSADGSTQQVTCGARDGTSGVGLCAVNVANAKFSTSESRTATLSLSVDGATFLDAFAAVALARALTASKAVIERLASAPAPAPPRSQRGRGMVAPQPRAVVSILQMPKAVWGD